MRYASFSQTTAGKQFPKKAANLIKFLDQYFDGWNKNKISAHAFLCMLLNLVQADLQERLTAANVTAGVMVSNLDRMPEIFDNAFPNYLESGLSNLILKQFK